MRRFSNQSNLLLVFLAFITLSTGCMKDRIRYTYQISTPIYEVLTSFRQSIKSVAPVSISSPGKMAVYGNYIFLSETGKGIHIIDNKVPSSPKNISFINIPGNQDFGIKGNALYADAYSDLVSFDISNPANVVTKNFLSNVFPENSIYGVSGSVNPDSINVIIGWNIRDTTVDANPANHPNIYPFFGGGCTNCYTLSAVPTAYASASASVTSTATNGSLSRFTIINNYMYTVDYSNLSAFSIADPFNPSVTSVSMVDYHVETIYPFKNNLFIGTNNGVYMYDISSSPANPALAGQFTHLRGCDPVIADSIYAYVTINDSSACLGFNDELQIVNIQDLGNSFLVKSYQLVHPIGLAKDNKYLFICDGTEGLKIFDASDVSNLVLVKQLTGAEVYDVVAVNGLAVVMSKNGLYEYDYSDINNVHLISKL